MADKRIIEQTATSEVFVDDWLVKDSSTEGTTKIRPSNLKDYIAAGLVPETMVADEYVTTSTYDSGDICIYEGVLYKALEDDITGDWDSTKWDAITISSELANTGTIASDVQYDNSSSTGVQATNVQDALDEAFQRTMDIGTWFTDVVAENYNYIKHYTVGDYVFHYPSSGVIKLYRCIENTSGFWDISKWEEVKLSNEVSDEVTLREELESATKVYGTPKNLPQPIATFTDGSNLPMPNLKVSIEPIQDLHGYDAPWVGGAGKNKLQVTATSQTINGVTFTVNDDGTIKVNGTATADARFVIGEYILKAGSSVSLNGSPVDGSTSTIALGYQGYGIVSTANSDKVCDRTSASTDWDNDVYISVTSGYTANNLTFKPMIRLTSVTDETFAPYSNICPISGWSAVDVNVSGKNLCGEFEIGTFAESSQIGSTYDEMKVANGARIRTKELIPTIDNNIVISCDFSNYQYCFCLYDADKKYLGEISGFASWETSASTPSTPSSYIAVAIKRNDGAVVTSADLENCHLQVELGTTATTYEPYNGQTYTIDLNGTRYGGKLDVVSGVLTVDRAIIDLGTLDWSYTSSSGRSLFTSNNITDYKHTGSNEIPVNAICECFENVSMNTTFVNGQMGMDGSETNHRTIICDNRYSSASDFKTAMNGVQLVYELATPLTIQLSPTPVISLNGVNNVWGDCGNIKELKYVRNLNITINDLISRVEALEGR